jgi:hypothetical protein
MTSTGTDLLIAVHAGAVAVPVVWDPFVHGDVVEHMAATMSAYDVRCVWKYGGYGQGHGPFPGVALALFQMIQGLRLWQLLELFGETLGDAWRSLDLSPLFPSLTRRVVVQAALRSPERSVSASGAKALHDRASARCVPLRGPNPAGTRLRGPVPT